MIERLKILLKNKIVLFFIPVFIYVFIFGGEYLFDIFFGDGDGKVTIPFYVKLKPIIKLGLLLYFILNIFRLLFKMSTGQSIFNISFIIFIFYGMEFYLKRTDPFIKGPFDSGHFNNNISKYKGLLTPPKDYIENYVTWGNSTKRNRYNFRDDEILFPKKKNAFRIMVLGDSFTWGAGLAESEMYTNILDSLLKRKFGSSNIEVLNCALAGSPTVRERNILRQLKDTVQPDLIVVGFCSNDPQPKSEDYSLEKEKFEMKYGRFLSYFQSCCNYIKLNYVGELFSGFVYTFQEKTGNIPGFHVALARVYEKKSKEWQDFETAIKDIKNISDSLKCCAPPVVGVFTQFRSFNAGEKLSVKDSSLVQISRGWINQAGSAFQKAGFITVNFIPVFENLVRENKIRVEDLKVNLLDAHPSAKMNRVFANELFIKIAPVITHRLDSLNLSK